MILIMCEIKNFINTWKGGFFFSDSCIAYKSLINLNELLIFGYKFGNRGTLKKHIKPICIQGSDFSRTVYLSTNFLQQCFCFKGLNNEIINSNFQSDQNILFNETTHIKHKRNFFGS